MPDVTVTVKVFSDPGQEQVFVGASRSGENEASPNVISPPAPPYKIITSTAPDEPVIVQAGTSGLGGS